MNQIGFGFFLVLLSTLFFPTEFKCTYNFRPNQYYVLYNYTCPFANIESNYTDVTLSCKNSDVLDLNMFPEVLFSNATKTLYMRDCKVPNITIDTIRKKLKINVLKEFVLRGCKNAECKITKDLFEGLNHLQMLELSSMNVARIEHDFLANIPYLRKIDLSINNLTEIDYIFNYTSGLKVINLSKNKLGTFPENLFSGLTNLSVLSLGYNNIITIHANMFLGLHTLQMLELSGNRITKLPNTVFFGLDSLISIYLNSNNISHVPYKLFSKNGRLLRINLSNNPIISLPGKVFANIPNVYYLSLDQCDLNILPPHMFQDLFYTQELYLSKNKLTVFSKTLFSNLTGLVILDLSYNEIEYIPKNMFSHLVSLKKLYLQHNKLTVLQKDLFRNTLLLEELNLNYNKISIIEPTCFSYLKALKYLKLTNNNLTNIKLRKADYIISDNTNFSFNLTKTHQYPIIFDEYNTPLNVSLKATGPVKLRIDLSNNTIKYIIYIRPKKFKYIWGVMEIIIDEIITCDCYIYDYLKKIKNQTRMQKVYTPNVSYNHFEFRKSNFICENYSPQKSVFDLELSNISCTLSDITWCPKKCTCLLRPHDRTMIIDCSYRNFTDIPKFEVQKMQFIDKILRIHREYNRTEVNLKGNYLINGPTKDSGYGIVTSLILSNNQVESLEWIPPNLRILNLDHNNLEVLNYQMIEMLKESLTLERIILSRNPWKCDCSAVELQKALVLLKPKVDPDDVICVGTQQPISVEDLCQLQLSTILLITALLFIIFSLITMLAIYYRFEREIKIYLFSKNLCLWFVNEEDLDQEKEYDVYLCYSHKNEDFVKQKLLPMLEKEPNCYKVCIHLRDWIPGEFITSQVIKSVKSSRRTLIVLTNDFIESVWCKMEFRTAHQQAIADGMARVIVVIYGELNKELLDDELTAYLRTNTYIKWEDTQWFESKLKYALPHSKVKIKGNIESVP